jgi:hypothetical protein
MNNTTQQIVNKAWNFAHVLRDDGLSYMAYTEQITFLLFLKMADEQTKPPYNRPPMVPAKMNWESLIRPGRRSAGGPLPAHAVGTRSNEPKYPRAERKCPNAHHNSSSNVTDTTRVGGVA